MYTTKPVGPFRGGQKDGSLTPLAVPSTVSQTMAVRCVGSDLDSLLGLVRGFPQHCCGFCGVNEHSTSVNNEYHRILQMLGPLLQLERGIRHFTKLVAFGGRSVHLFRPLLQRRDPKALLLLSYWFALLRQLDQWWLNIRVRSTCHAIVTYLRAMADPTMNALLSFPASCADGTFDRYSDL